MNIMVRKSDFKNYDYVLVPKDSELLVDGERYGWFDTYHKGKHDAYLRLVQGKISGFTKLGWVHNMVPLETARIKMPSRKAELLSMIKNLKD